MSQIYAIEQPKTICAELELTSIIEQGFAAYSRGEVVVPPVAEMSFEHPLRDTHITYVFIKKRRSYRY